MPVFRPDRPLPIGHGTDTAEESAPAGGASPTTEPAGQDTGGAGRSVGFGITAVLGVGLLAVPLVWALLYLRQASATGLDGGLLWLVAIVVLAVLVAGGLLLRALLHRSA
jgi:hypothetical protein